MKKVILFICLMIAISVSYAQLPKDEVKYFYNLVIEECDMLIIKEYQDGDFYTVVTQLPSYYDFELFQTKVKGIYRRYNDITVFDNWTYMSNSNSYVIFLGITENNYSLAIGYSLENKNLVIFVSQ